MKTKDLLTMTAFAISTATLTVATFLAGPLDAGTETGQLAAPITKPRLVAHGVELTVGLAEGRPFKAGDQPVFDLHAVNTADESADVTVRLTMYASAPVSPLSRAMPVPALLWQEERLLTFEPNENKTVTFPARTNLPVNSMISVALAEVGPSGKRTDTGAAVIASAPRGIPATGHGIVALRFSTAKPKANPAFAAGGRPDSASDLVNHE